MEGSSSKMLQIPCGKMSRMVAKWKVAKSKVPDPKLQNHAQPKMTPPNNFQPLNKKTFLF
jgi:hypothetical protein